MKAWYLMMLACALLSTTCIPGITNQCSYSLSDEFVLTTRRPKTCSLVNGIQVALLFPQEKGMAPSVSLSQLDSSQIFSYYCYDIELFDDYFLQGVGSISFFQPKLGYKWRKLSAKEAYDVFSWEILPDRWYRIGGLLEGGAPIMTLFFMKTNGRVVTKTYVRPSNY